MSKLEFFQKAGLFLKEEFLSPQDCETIQEEMKASQQMDATVGRQGAEDLVVDPYLRKTRMAKVSKATRLRIDQSLASLLPALGAHFNVTLKGMQPTNYLVYRERDFFARHSDVAKSEERAEGRRKVSIVVFLNDQSEVPTDGAYVGGSLVFYGLLPPPFQILGRPLVGQRGCLVAFRSDVPHEVQPVTHGIRYTLVSWCE